MAITNPLTRNGYDPRPGVVHRPTRVSLPPAFGPHLPHPPNYGLAERAPAIDSPRPGTYLSVPERTMTTGSHVPATPSVTDALDVTGLAKHMVTSPTGLHIRKGTHPRVAECIVRLLARLGINTTADSLAAA